MVFTVGLTEQYENYIDTDENVGKGKGGSVWHTRQDAQYYLDKTGQSDYSVYGVYADWYEDAEVTENEWRALTHEAKLFRLEPIPT